MTRSLPTPLASTGRVDEAETHYRAAVAFAPAHAAARYNLANVLLRRGQATEAILQYRAALEVTPDDPEVLNNLAAAYAAAGRLDEAIAMARRGVDVARASPGFEQLASEIDANLILYVERAR